MQRAAAVAARAGAAAAETWPERITPEHVVTLIRRERDVNRALAVFNASVAQGLKPNVDAYGLMIGRLAMSLRFADAETLVARLEASSSSAPSPLPEPILHTLCSAYGRAHRPVEALRTFQRMKSPSLHSYVTILAVLVRHGRGELAAQFYRHMVKVLPESRNCVAVCNVRLKALCRSSETVDAAEAFLCREMPRRGAVPDAFSYATVLHGLCTHGRFDRAKAIFRDMPPEHRSVAAYNALIHGGFKAGDPEFSRQLFDEMREENSGLRPSAVSYGAVINGLCKCSLSAEALDLVFEMIRKRLKPNVKIFSALVHGFCSESRYNDALMAIDQMRLRGFRPDAALYHAVIKGFCVKSPRRAAVLLDEVISGVGVSAPNRLTRRLHESMHGAVIQGLCRVGDPEDALRFYNHAVFQRASGDKQFRLAFEDFGSLVEALCGKRKFFEAARVVSGMQEFGCVPDEKLWSAVVRGLCAVPSARASVTSKWKGVVAELFGD